MENHNKGRNQRCQTMKLIRVPLGMEQWVPVGAVASFSCFPLYLFSSLRDAEKIINPNEFYD